MENSPFHSGVDPNVVEDVGLVMVVEKVQGMSYLQDNRSHFFFLEDSMLLQLRIQRSLLHILQDYVEISGIIKEAVDS